MKSIESIFLRIKSIFLEQPFQRTTFQGFKMFHTFIQYMIVFDMLVKKYGKKEEVEEKYLLTTRFQ